MDNFYDEHVQRELKEIGYANNIVKYLSSTGMDETEKLQTLEKSIIIIAYEYKTDIEAIFEFFCRNDHKKYKKEYARSMKVVFNQYKDYITKITSTKEII